MLTKYIFSKLIILKGEIGKTLSFMYWFYEITNIKDHLFLVRRTYNYERREYLLIATWTIFQYIKDWIKAIDSREPGVVLLEYPPMWQQLRCTFDDIVSK